MSATAKTELTRQQLYDQVWATPVRVLAQRYELSDVGLAKICKRYDIPRPPVGYWAKLEHGKKVAQPKLPPPPAGVGEVVVIASRVLQDAHVVACRLSGCDLDGVPCLPRDRGAAPEIARHLCDKFAGPEPPREFANLLIEEDLGRGGCSLLRGLRIRV